MKRLSSSLALFCVVLLSACSAKKGTESSIETVRDSAYRSSTPPSLTVMTMVNNRTGRGGHTALAVNASQRVIFDPAGSFRDPRVVERQDVIYGVSDAILHGYKSSHARKTHRVVSQEILVSAQTAELALQRVMQHGAVPSAYCANSTSTLLTGIPGFENIKTTMFPENLMKQVAKMPNVRTTELIENDSGKVSDAIKNKPVTQ